MKSATVALMMAIAAFAGAAWYTWDITGPAAAIWLGFAPIAAFGVPALGVKSLDWAPYRTDRRS